MGIYPIAPARAVFLDRDGVLNATVTRAGGAGPPWRLEDFRLLPGVDEACQVLAAAGWRLIVVTNQPDVARGQLSPAILEAVHARLRTLLPLDDIIVCPHDNRDRCACRKPLPGMLLAAASKYGVDLSQSWMVGDRCKDIQAGAAAGVGTILICDAPAAVECRPDFRTPSLLAAAGHIRAARRGAGGT